jgi:hypothetical protein
VFGGQSNEKSYVTKLESGDYRITGSRSTFDSIVNDRLIAKRWVRSVQAWLEDPLEARSAL